MHKSQVLQHPIARASINNIIIILQTIRILLGYMVDSLLTKMFIWEWGVTFSLHFEGLNFCVFWVEDSPLSWLGPPLSFRITNFCSRLLCYALVVCLVWLFHNKTVLSDISRTSSSHTGLRHVILTSLYSKHLPHHPSITLHASEHTRGAQYLGSATSGGLTGAFASILSREWDNTR